METFENLVCDYITSLGLEYRKQVKIGRWSADIVIDTPAKNCVVMEIREKGSIPDVLTTASMTHWFTNNVNRNNRCSTFGTLSLKECPSNTVFSVAEKNNIFIICWGSDSYDVNEAKEQIRAITSSCRVS
ncbi:hypothetical protein ISS40_11000 [Candidatus Bathyarchaeota archaeon]|nr:hypothetical protein [Candidatus Bathyarchaeota archaeon]